MNEGGPHEPTADERMAHAPEWWHRQCEECGTDHVFPLVVGLDVDLQDGFIQVAVIVGVTDDTVIGGPFLLGLDNLPPEGKDALRTLLGVLDDKVNEHKEELMTAAAEVVARGGQP